jgi:hypothetical protein
MKGTHRNLALAAALIAALSVVAVAQVVSGALTGTIYDATGGTIPTATILAKNDATGVEYTTKATTTGEYHFTSLPVGSYTLTITAPGFSAAQAKGVAVVLGKVGTVNITLQIGAKSETVDVTATAPNIDTTTAHITNAYETKQIMDLPTASTGSGVLNLSLLNAGVTSSGSVGVGSGPSVGGQRPRQNNFMIEGIDNNSGSVTGPLVTIPNDGVAEFTIQQNQFSPEFGHSTGGQFNTIVRSGTNAFHGIAYEYLENRNMNAADNLNAVNAVPLHPRYDNNRFGGALGGPIRRNKAFFYALYEYNPIGAAGSAGLLFAPTAAGYALISAMPGINQTSLAQLQKYIGTAAVAVAPSVVNGYPLVGPGNASLGLQNPATAVSIPVGQIGIVAPNFTNNSAGIAAIDYNISEKDALRGRFILNRSGFIDTAASLPVFYTHVPSNNYMATLAWYHTFTPAIINEFRFGYNRFSNDYSAGNFTWPGLDAFPNVNVFELNAQLGPDPNAPQFAFQNLYQLTDSLTWTRGGHSFKFGFDGWRNITPQSFTQRLRGDYEWSFLSDYLFDYNPDYLAQRSLGNFIYWGNRNLLAGFANDNWKIHPNLSVNIGVRYEFNGVPASQKVQTLNAASSVPGLITFGEPQAQKENWEPRIGVAWSPGTSGRTSIRAGFGRAFDVLFDNLGLLTLPPQVQTTVDVTGLNQGGFLAGGGIPPNTPSTSLTVPEARALTGGFVPDQTRPQSLQWNFGVQHVFAKNYSFETRYLGTRGIHLPVQIQLNRQPVVTAANALPVFFTAPSQAALNSLPNTLSALNAAFNAHGNIMPAYLAAGFTGIITSYQPWGSSTYNGWANQLTRQFSNGLQFIASYTWSHNIDNSTAEVFSTYTTPRRPSDSTNLRLDRSSSALDHRHRFTGQALYDVPWYKNSRSWVLRNLVGNWEVAPIYTYQTGTWATIQAGTDSNLNGDSAGDRTFVNPAGNPNIGSGTTPLTNSAGATVAYLVNNPAAGYIAAPRGTLPNGGRNTFQLPAINNWDLTAMKRFTYHDRYNLELAGRFLNLFNHPQFVGGYINDIQPVTGQSPGGGAATTAVHNLLIPTTGIFANPSQAFSSNPRSIQVSAKFIF